ncbi:MAG: flagellar biosynthesis protein FlhF [Spirochaetota bacterium]|nr:flagellar biosynthesis protein FlhF [Spirochaetota bacterium]
MKYVKIKAKTYNETMMKLKMEYGDDAIPVSHKYIKEGGLFNTSLFAKDMVELTAAIPEKKNLMKDKQMKNNKVDFTVGDTEMKKSNASANISSLVTNVNKLDELKKTLEIKNKPPDYMNTGKGSVINNDSLSAALTPKKETEGTIQVNMDEFRVLKRFEKEFQGINDSLTTLLKANQTGERLHQSVSEEDRTLDPYLYMLRENEFTNEDCNLLINEVKNSVSKDDLRDRYKIEKTLKELLKNKIVTSGPFKKSLKKKIIMFIGPTGVGKTTTMAKLGAIYALRECYNVAFITIDTYRIAATEQLKKYAGIMKIPIHVINDHHAFKDVIEKEPAEVIMVDTSGRSHKNELKISEIKSYADVIECDFEKILCVSANTKKNDLDNVFRAFDKINFNSIIITKVDETSYIGSVIDIANKYKKPISYFTNGQEVPNDIEVAESDRIVDMIVKGIG